MKAKKAQWKGPFAARELARNLDKTPRGLGEFLRRTPSRTLRRLGIRRLMTRRNRLMVFLTDDWLVDGRPVAWAGEAAAAARLGITRTALLEALEESSGGGWVSSYKGFPARRLVGCWLLCFEKTVPETASCHAQRCA